MPGSEAGMLASITATVRQPTRLPQVLYLFGAFLGSLTWVGQGCGIIGPVWNKMKLECSSKAALSYGEAVLAWVSGN